MHGKRANVVLFFSLPEETFVSILLATKLSRGEKIENPYAKTRSSIMKKARMWYKTHGEYPEKDVRRYVEIYR